MLQDCYLNFFVVTLPPQESKISDAMAISPQDQGSKLIKPPLQVPEDISRMILSPQVIECKLTCSSDNGDVATISGSCGTGINKVCQEFKGIEKDSEKESPEVSITANCRGAQAKFIPAC
ncbi:hypothetical protein K457DRAFT_17439 [Linnemannia elongata AG-77]|uniref:Uncharacterized protein n=1 Tax=Linnemannia elongata AG-77 TaxID=1314771 RepID=A0A197K3R2_9FUNG|nr:hypothetical protein K457DRAFT_17439 [Linnemannia elongata AG-77]